MMRNFKFFLVVGVFFSFPAWSSLYTSNGFHTYFNNPPNAKYIDLRVATLIDSSKVYCYVAVYSLNLPRIVTSLIARKQAGVDVRIVTEKDNRDNSEFKSAYDQLAAAGIPIVTDNRSALMHHKFIVLDDNEVLAGSYNFDQNSTTYHKNNIVVIHSSGVAARFKAEFLDMFAGNFGTNKTDHSGMNTVNGTSVYTKFAPKSNCQSSILYHLNTANVSVYFNIFTFTDQQIADKLISLHKSGVTVKGTMDAFQTTSASSQYQRLVDAGVPVKKDNYSGFLHDKFFAIDAGTSSTPRVITGSYNWTSSANSSNDETLLIIYDDATIGKSYKGNAVYVYTYKSK